MHTFYARNPRARLLVESKLGLPDFMKTAEALTAPETANLPPTVFADARRQFPLHTKEATYASAVSILSENVGGKPLEQLKLASRVWGIVEDVEKLEQLFAAQTKQAAAEPLQKFALTVDQEDGSTTDYFPLNDIYEVEESARGLNSAVREWRMPLAWSKAAAIDLCKEAEALGLSAHLPPLVASLGEDNLPDFQKAAMMNDFRSRHLQLPAEAAELYRDLVKAAAEDPESLDSLLDLYCEMDCQKQIKYSALVPHPYQIFCSGTPVATMEKLAREVVILNDVMIPRDVLKRLPDARIDQRFRKDPAAIIKAAKSMDAAPACDKLAELSESLQGELLALLVDA